MIDKLLEDVRRDFQLTSTTTGFHSLSHKVASALRVVPREMFVPQELQPMSYDNRPLPIGYGQTISQPFIVALMTQYLDIHSNDIILEIGTGCGYQAAILGELAKQVYSIEIIPTLAESTRQRLQKLGYKNIEVYSQDGHLGLEDYAPYDSIIVTATGKTIPKALIQQLKHGGKMILPIGGEYETQYLTLIQKKSDDQIEKLRSIPVRFVPLTHE